MFNQDTGRILLLMLLLVTGIGGAGIARENADTLHTETAVDTLKLLSDSPLKSPRGAVFRSMILPGWGQWYNEKPFKALLVLGLHGALAGSSYRYHQKWLDESETSENPDKGIRGRRNTYNWFLAVSYLLNMADAYVDAYLFKFDEAMDITFQPNARYGSPEWQVGLRLKL